MKTYRAVSWACFTQLVLALIGPGSVHAQPSVYLTEVPNYNWHAGCFGTASGNLAGFWDRHGFSNIYTGLVDNGVAPLRDEGKEGIRSIWASAAGQDGRPANKPGHMDDYYVTYQSTAQDPYITGGRPEHSPDCTGDFMGLSQKKWSNLNGECSGNIDAFSFVYWDKTGNRRNNYYTTNNGTYVPDIGSGLKEWMRWRGYDADTFTQLAEFNPERTVANTGFTYDDIKREIDAGYPVLCFLQPYGEFSRNIGGIPNANPEIHGVMIYGYFSDTFSGITKGLFIRTSWGSAEGSEIEHVSWSSGSWIGTFPVRGVIGFHPKPRIKTFTRSGGNLTLTWEGPATFLYDEVAGTTSPQIQSFLVQRATNLTTGDWKTVAGPMKTFTVTIPQPSDSAVFYRVVTQ